MNITKLSIISKDKFILSLLVLFVVVCTLNCIFATGYIYDINNEQSNKKTEESSISRIASPEFTFESVAQVLMEPTTGKIIYANNENERLLPASVTKIMTMLLTMEQIDSRKTKI